MCSGSLESLKLGIDSGAFVYSQNHCIALDLKGSAIRLGLVGLESLEPLGNGVTLCGLPNVSTLMQAISCIAVGSTWGPFMQRISYPAIESFNRILTA